MKKVISLITCLVLMMSLCITANAAGSAALSGGTSATVGSNMEFTVSVSGCGDATSVAVSVTYGEGFELVSGTWLKSGSLSVFDTAKNKGSLGGLSSPDINGNLFKLVLKAKTASASAQNVSVNIIAKNGSNEILNTTPAKSVKINCATHNYGAYTKVNDTQHSRTCSACGNVETLNHTWNAGTVTKAATCKETGTKTFTCTACNATKTETIAKTTAHTYGSYKTTKEPTCTAQGTETATCSVCGVSTSRNIPAKGHKYGSWTTTTEATCTAQGTQTRTCSTCGNKETKSIAALGHSFSNPTVTKQPTCTESGEKTGKCSRCGQTTKESIKPTGHKFENWADETAATCTTGGVQKRTCKVCKTEEKRNTDALGHDFESPVILKEPTIYSAGLMQGKCKRCGETTEQKTPCTYNDENSGIKFETDEGVFAEGTQISIESIDIKSEVYESAKNILSEISGEFTIYDISALLNGAKVQPNGKVKVSFEIPEGYGKDVAVYYVGDDGTYEKIDGTISEDGKTIIAELEHFSLYAVCKIGTDNADETSNDIATGTQNNSNNILWIIISVIAVIAIGIVAILILIKKKKQTKI